MASRVDNKMGWMSREGLIADKAICWERVESGWDDMDLVWIFI